MDACAERRKLGVIGLGRTCCSGYVYIAAAAAAAWKEATVRVNGKRMACVDEHSYMHSVLLSTVRYKTNGLDQAP